MKVLPFPLQVNCNRCHGPVIESSDETGTAWICSTCYNVLVRVSSRALLNVIEVEPTPPPSFSVLENPPRQKL